jgi:hypothetical protein
MWTLRRRLAARHPGPAALPMLKEHDPMKNHFRPARLGALLVILLTASMTTAHAASVLPLGSSAEIPAAQGDVRLQTTHNGNIEIKLRVKHLAPASRITPGAEVFVLWARGLAAGSAAQNLGALKVDKNLNGKITALTSMPSFDLFITSEASQTAIVPAHLELLPFHYPSK